MALSKESIRKLRAVKAAILAEPELYNQSIFPSKHRSFCDTPCCIEGWAAWVNNPDPKVYQKRCLKQGGFDLAEELGLTGDEGSLLFSNWPIRFLDAWEYPGTKRAARAGAARIDHFIATDGRE